jgi:hypothetical protein
LVIVQQKRGAGMFVDPRELKSKASHPDLHFMIDKYMGISDPTQQNIVITSNSGVFTLIKRVVISNDIEDLQRLSFIFGIEAIADMFNWFYPGKEMSMQLRFPWYYLLSEHGYRLNYRSLFNEIINIKADVTSEIYRSYIQKYRDDNPFGQDADSLFAPIQQQEIENEDSFFTALQWLFFLEDKFDKTYFTNIDGFNQLIHSLTWGDSDYDYTLPKMNLIGHFLCHHTHLCELLPPSSKVQKVFDFNMSTLPLLQRWSPPKNSTKRKRILNWVFASNMLHPRFNFCVNNTPENDIESEGIEDPDFNVSALQSIFEPVQKKIITPPYDLSLINTDKKIDTLINILKASKTKPEIGGAKIMFSGPTGTGKTAFAKHAIEQAGYKLKIYRSSDILAWRIGESEQRLAEIFQKVSPDEVILIDEIDGLIYSRGMATRGWEYSIINEFLVQLQEYQNHIIVTTNQIENIDEAFYRRFPYKYKFSPLVKKAVTKALHLYFPDYFSEDTLLGILSDSQLTLGDFAVVWELVQPRIVLEEEITQDEILQLLKTESGYRSRDTKNKIGFKVQPNSDALG